MNYHLQVKVFDEITSDTTKECNKFLKEIGSRVKDVTSVYNTIIGGVVHIVTYHC
jgi:hypothetical protein